MQTDLFKLTELADIKLIEELDLVFNEQVEVVLGILRSSGVLPYKRSTQNGYLHKLFSATVVMAYHLDIPIFVTSRKTNSYVERGITTCTLQYLDKMVAEKLLIPEVKHYRAEGKLQLADVLINQISAAPTVKGYIPVRHSEQLVSTH
jgi:hypothetical protein|tara:strand:- start:340 stop:783 length:444 start_codon:yes stop_codon:yes gene_type:complete